MWVIVHKQDGRYFLSHEKEFNNWHAALMFATAKFGNSPEPPAEPNWVILPFSKAMELTQ